MAGNNKTLSSLMRSLHRDFGFMIIGITIVFSLSGILLIYRDTDFMKKEVQVKKILPPALKADQLSSELRLRDLRFLKTEGDNLYFEGGSYNVISGQTIYTTTTIKFPFNKFIDFHKTSSSKSIHWVATIFAFLLLFMAVSSLWMIKRNSRYFKRSIILVSAGIIFTVLVIFMN